MVSNISENGKMKLGITIYNYLNTSVLQNATKKLIKIVEISVLQTKIKCLT